jgi:hypothetical protein
MLRKMAFKIKVYSVPEIALKQQNLIGFENLSGLLINGRIKPQ